LPARRGALVLLPGDLSMARNHRDLQPDLAWLDRLPGTKVLSPGNHDQWWNGVAKIRPMLRESLRAVDGDALELGSAVVSGSAAVPTPTDGRSESAAEGTGQALESLRASLAEATRLRTGATLPLYVLWHYPPFDAHGRPGPCVELFEHSSVTACVYGHLHRPKEWASAVQGLRRGVRYYCVAADAIGFCPLRIDTTAGP
jgi:predicted phosphohydrolase